MGRNGRDAANRQHSVSDSLQLDWRSRHGEKGTEKGRCGSGRCCWVGDIRFLEVVEVVEVVEVGTTGCQGGLSKLASLD